MADNIWQITCINKDPRLDPYRRIQRVGGIATSGPWTLKLHEAIDGMENKGWQFYVSVDGDSVWVDIAVSQAGNKYLKTRNDGDAPNNLLSLPECPPG